MSKQEGELKKFIEMFEATSLNHLDTVIARALYRKLDEAKKEFPKYPEPLKGEDFSQKEWNDILDIWNRRVLKWFLKNFGKR